MSPCEHKVDGEYNSCTMLVLRLYRMYAQIVLNVFFFNIVTSDQIDFPEVLCPTTI